MTQLTTTHRKHLRRSLRCEYCHRTVERILDALNDYFPTNDIRLAYVTKSNNIAKRGGELAFVFPNINFVKRVAELANA
jgi:hypothetical protein